jgi:hypothetical protein
MSRTKENSFGNQSEFITVTVSPKNPNEVSFPRQKTINKKYIISVEPIGNGKDEKCYICMDLKIKDSEESLWMFSVEESYHEVVNMRKYTTN